MSKPKLVETETPALFSSREKLQETITLGVFAEAVGASEKEYLQAILEVLRGPELSETIDAGNLTLAMIKPALTESSNLDPAQYSEDQQAQKMLSDIKKPLDIVFEIVLKMDDETIENWYGGAPKAVQVTLPALDPQRYGQSHSSRWEEYKAMMQRGPVTFMLLGSQDNNAVAEWRQQMGNHWNIEQVKIKFPDSLRAKYGKDLHNNLVHGSDSIESVHREVALLANLIEKLV